MNGESDYAADMAAADRADAALDRALTRAHELAESPNRDWARHELAPEVDVLIEPGSEDYVLVFTVALQLSDDFDTAEWPEDGGVPPAGRPAGTGSRC